MKIRHIYRLTASLLAITMLVTAIVITGNCAVMNMRMDMHSHGITQSHMMANHECCKMDMNGAGHNSSSKLSNSNSDWCQCRIAQPGQTNRLTIITSPARVHFYPVVLAAVEPVTEKAGWLPKDELKSRFREKVPIFIQNLSLLD